MARLIIASPDGKRGILELTRPLITIGRGSGNDLVLNDPSVSRLHAVIKQSDSGDITVADRGSTNGVLLQGKRITAETPLQPGDKVRIGIYELKLESTENAAVVVARADIPSTLKEVLQGRAVPKDLSRVLSTSDMSEVMRQFWKLEHENFLLRMLYDAGKALNSKLSVDAMADQVMELAFRIEGVERGFVMFFDAHGQVVRQTDVRYRRPPATDQPPFILSRSVLQSIRTERAPILISDVSVDERFRNSESLKISGLRSAMCAPLVGTNSGQLLAILYLDNMERTAAFTQEELNVFAVLASQAASAMDNALAHDQLASQMAQRRALERFLAPEVVEMIAANPENVHLGGANQKVSILFADIRGFTSLSEKLPPETIVEVLNHYFTRITDVIFDHGGTLDKYLGDGVMAVFGAPISKGNDALNAVKVAVGIQRLMHELNRDAAERGWPELRVGMGINTGVATAGNIGSPRRIDYTVVGDAVNVAARLMAHAAPGQILIAESTAADIGTAFGLVGLQPLSVKGKSAPIPVFSVEWQVAGAPAPAKA